MRAQVKNAFLLSVRASSPLLNAAYSLRRRLVPDYRVAVIMYHKISALTEGLDAEWNVSPTQFREQMAMLASDAFNVISLEAFADCLASGRSPPRNAVVITFDDGYANVYQHAFPVLQEFGLPATIFQTVQFAHEQRLFSWDEAEYGAQPELFDAVRPLSWNEIRAMCQSGLITMGSHTMTHPHLGRLSPQQIRFEVGESKRLLEEHTGQPIRFFAFPGGIRRYGDISETAIETLVDCGYTLACTSAIGRNAIGDDPFGLKRTGIGRVDTPALFRAKLIGAYDWVNHAQTAFQRVFGAVY
jgi:peptidoglycan/xylan/chitin deacetylase (PgdA/CDA1 family)